jgi:hypothetical protein
VNNPISTTDAATETLANVIRLYRDSRLLFEHERYASCASLAVLALEELAKFMALAGFQELQRGELRHHSARHISAASFLLRNCYQAALRETLVEHRVCEPPAAYERLMAMDGNLRKCLCSTSSSVK